MSVNIENLRSDITKIVHYYELNPYHSPLYTLPEIFKREYHENFISDWLAYLLDPEKNGYGMEPLMKLCNHFEFDISIASRAKIIREQAFDDNKRIDFYIEVQSDEENLLLVGVENKIEALEDIGQTDGYHKRLKKIKEEKKFKELLPIYLRKEENPKAQCKDFKNISYSELKELFETIPFTLRRDSRKSFYFYEFILYVEEIIMNQTKKELSEAAKLYLENKTDIDNAIKEYNDYIKIQTDKIIEIANDIAKGDGFYFKSPNEDKGRNIVYWQIHSSKKEWIQGFHYELLYSNKKKLFELNGDEAQLEIHIETRSPNVKKNFNTKNRTLFKEKTNLDFSDEDKTKETIKEIINKIKKPEYQKFEKIAIEAAKTEKSRQ